MYRILGKHLVLEGPQFPRIFPQAKSSIVQGKVFTAVPYETDVCKFLETRGYKIPPPPFDKYRILNKHLVLEGDNFPSLFPQAKTSVVQGRCFTALPHELEICQYLNNLGYTVPSPITTQYPFRSKYPSPMPHQVETASFLTLNRRAFNLSGMGCVEGDAVITANRHGKTFNLTLRELYHRWHNPGPTSTGNDAWKCRSLLGDRFGHNQIEDVLYKGVKPTLRIELEDGKVIQVTHNHNMAQPDGTYVEAGKLRVGDELVTNGKVMIPCPLCGTLKEVVEYNVKRAARQTCRSCRYKKLQDNVGAKNPNWKGGKSFVDKDGYVRVYLPSHQRADRHGRVYEHIVVAEEKYKCHITKEHHVHHIDGCKHNNDPNNLELLTANEHHSERHSHFEKFDGVISGKGGKMVILPKRSKIISITNGIETDVYDLSMKAPHHNFVANGIVVHNSAKTLSSLWAADFLRLTGAIRRVLVVSPLSTLQVVWGKEIFTNFPHMSYAILHGSRDTRRELCEQKHDVYVVNHHGVELVKEYLPEDIDLVIVDEVAIYRTHTTNLWKALKSYIKPNHWVWGMTGTPTPNSPTDAYGQMKLIVPERYPNMSFTRCKYEMMLKLSMFKWIPRKGAEQKAYDMLQPAIRYDISQCINMPETIYHDRECELSREQKHHYKEIENECFTDINGVTITAVNGAVLLGKLIQASCGVVYGPKGEIAKLDFGPRLSVLKECIESCNEKVIVFVPLTGMLKALYDKLSKKWKCGVIDGSVSSGKRNQIFNEFQDGSEMKVLLANPSAMSHGINLTCATTTVWYCPIHSNEVYQQANARMRRPGQKKTMNIVHMYGTKVEARIYKRLQEKGSLQDLVLDLVSESM